MVPATTAGGSLPLLDEHRTTVAAPREVVWSALERFVSTLGISTGHPVAWLLDTSPPTGFAVAGKVPLERVEMAGRHRFSTYTLVFELQDAGAATDVAPGTTVVARSYAAFPGLHGRAYRRMLLLTGAHVRAIRRMLREIERLSR